MRYSQIKKALIEAEILDEVSMSPTSLKQWLAGPEADGMLIGFEFEMGVPGAAVDSDDGDGEYDYDMDERAYDIDGIIQFFREGDMSDLSYHAGARLSSKMSEQWDEWQREKISDNMDEDDLNSRIFSLLKDDLDLDDFVDEAKAQLKAEDKNWRDVDPVYERANALRDQAIEEIIKAQDSDWSLAYDSVREAIEEEMREDSDYDQHAWLQDIGIESMSDAENEWDLSWPHWTAYNTEGDVSIDQVAEDFKEAFDLDRVNTSDSYHSARRDGVNWIIEPDSSISADNSGDGGLEFISPPMPLRDGLEMVKKFKEWAGQYGCYTNKSTGLHTNISVPDMNIDKLDYVKLALFMGDEHVLKEFGREYNSYCKSAIKIIKERATPEHMSAVLKSMKQHLNSLASKTVHSGITDKFTSINTKDKYVEFRGPGGDYLDMDIDKLLNTALRLAMSLRIATNPEAHKQEYAKKLYKLVEQGNDPDDSIKLFSQYAAGDPLNGQKITKEELFARIKFAQQGRKDKKLKPTITRATDDPEIKVEIESLPYSIKTFIIGIQKRLPVDLDQYLHDLESGALERVHGRLTPEQKSLITHIIENEKEVRALKGDDKQWWVTNKKGGGGMQAVFAASENEAILKGGKQMGMSREDSIIKLKAEEKKDDVNIPGVNTSSLPQRWKEYTGVGLRGRDLESIQNIRQGIINGVIGGGDLTSEHKDIIVRAIDAELRRRNESIPDDIPGDWRTWIDTISTRDVETIVNMRNELESAVIPSNISATSRAAIINAIDNEIHRRHFRNNMPASVTDHWNDWVEDTMPHITVDILNSVREVIVPGLAGMPAAATNWIISQIDTELHKRRAVDNNETRWKIKLNIPTTNPNYDPIFVDSDSPGQAKAKAVDIFRREQNLIVTIGDLDAIATTPDAGQPDRQNIPQVWHAWINTLPNRSVETINNFRYQIEQGEQNGTLPNQSQRDALVRIIDAELRSRQDAGETTERREWIIRDSMGREVDRINARNRQEAFYIYGNINNVNTTYYTAEVATAGGTIPTGLDQLTTASSGEVFDSLPVEWKDWLQHIGDAGDANLQSNIDDLSSPTNNYRLTREQVHFMLTYITQEQRRRAIIASNNAIATAAAAGEERVRDSLPTAHQQWITDIKDHSDMSLINVLHNVAVSNLLTDQQAAYFRVRIKHELRRRGINPDEAATQSALDFEPDRDAPAPEQPPATSPAGSLDNNTRGDFEIRNSENRQVVSVVRNGTELYAENQARSLEQQLRLAPGVLRVTPLPIETTTPLPNRGPWYRVGSHTYGREVLRAESEEDAINQFAFRNGLTQAQSTGITAEITNQMDESALNRLKMLAGLK